MRVAIVHYWMVNMRGGERVLEALCELYPDADIFTHVYAADRMSPVIRQHRVRTTFIGSLPWARQFYQSYLPLMPLALEQLDLREYDLVISSEFGPAKGVLTRPDSVHVCYCHTPMRYAWNMYQDYMAGRRGPMRWAMAVLLHRLRQWDVTAAARVDHFVANSLNVAMRIRKYYRRDAMVIPPPVDVELFGSVANDVASDTYVCIGQLIPYKRVDIAVEAFNRLGKKLIVIGEGSHMLLWPVPHVQTLASSAGSTIRRCANTTQAAGRLYSRARRISGLFRLRRWLPGARCWPSPGAVPPKPSFRDCPGCCSMNRRPNH